ncbi:MAG: transglutaminase domain-containing protein [Candidatus Coatesbacteria bacterium]
MIFALLMCVSGTTVRAEPATTRRYDLTLRITEPASRPGSLVRWWLPMPQPRRAQQAELVRHDLPRCPRVMVESEFGNLLLYAETESGPAPRTWTLTWRVTRSVQTGLTGAIELEPRPFPVALYVRPRGLVQVTGEIRAMAEDATRGLAGTPARARSLYELVLGRMRYDKSGVGWGRGDSVFACDVRRGNCTDFHSLFMALAISAGLPTRFNMGLPIPGAPAGDLAGYHCWAEFYEPDRGWVPVDISEAWRRKDRREFYFGALDADRVLLSVGRDIRLAPAPASRERLNWFLDPYAEVHDRPLAGVTAHWSWHNLTQSQGGDS